MSWPPYALAWLAAINLLTLVAFAGDKRAAVRGRRRTPERTLLWMALLGGSPAAIAAQKLLRHKTRKEPFRTLLLATACAQAILLALAAAWLFGWPG